MKKKYNNNAVLYQASSSASAEYQHEMKVDARNI